MISFQEFNKLLSSLTPLMTAAIVIVASPIKELIYSFCERYIPSAVQNFLDSIYRKYFITPQFTLLIGNKRDNQIYEAAKTYLRSKIAVDSSGLKCLKVSKIGKQQELTLDMVPNQVVMDSFQDINWLKWKFCRNGSEHSKQFKLSFEEKFKEAVLKSYLPYVISRSEAIQEEQRKEREQREQREQSEQKKVKLYSLDDPDHYRSEWGSIILEHPATFEKLAMDPERKKSLIEDLNRFHQRKEWYKKVGRAWKRGYLIYGPPGTGKSTLIAAMANLLKFDIYELNISSIDSDSALRTALRSTTNGSIVVIEDIDCAGLQKRGEEVGNNYSKITLSGLLNVIDGFSSSIGDERIIVFTTNHKDRLINLDSALLRPGRMDKQVHMSYCTMDGFKLLASTYLDINEDHQLYEQIERFEPLFRKAEVTPAEIAEELSATEDAGVALGGVVELLKENIKKKELENSISM